MEQFDITTAKYIKRDSAISFVCARCGKEKQAKKNAELLANGEKVQICNGCYGFLKAQPAKIVSEVPLNDTVTEPVIPSMEVGEGLGQANVYKKSSFMSYLTEDDIEYICQIITSKSIRGYFQKNSKEFSKIRPGFRAASLSDAEAIKLVCKYITRPFINDFVEDRIAKWVHQIEEYRKGLEKQGMPLEEALLKTIPECVFSGNVELFFKLSCKDLSQETIKFIVAALNLQAEIQSTEPVLIAEAVEIEHSNAELEEKVSQLQASLEEAENAYSEMVDQLATVTATNKMLEESLKNATEAQLIAADKAQSMQMELDRYSKLSQYADSDIEDEYSDEYEFTSLCEVYTDSYTGRVWLSRLADISNGEVFRFVRDDTAPRSFANRDRLFFKHEGERDGFIGVWQWNAIPKSSDPTFDDIDASYISKAKVIEIVELSECQTSDDIVVKLKTDVFSMFVAEQVLFVCNTSPGTLGVLCNKNDFDFIGGKMKLKSTIYKLPYFEISANNILRLSVHKFYSYTSLGIPQGLIQIKNPLAVVKDIIVSRATNATLRLQGMTNREAQHCQEFLRNLPCNTLYEDVSNAYSCSPEEAKEYVSTFIEQGDSYLSESDFDAATLSTVLHRNQALVNECKEMLKTEWQAEYTVELQEAHQRLSEVNIAADAQRNNISALQKEYATLEQQLVSIQVEIEDKTVLASEVETKVSERIAKARQDAASFICDMAFTAPYGNERAVVVPTADLPTLHIRTIETNSGDPISDIESLVDELAENLSATGYEDVVAAEMAELLVFSMENKLPVVCDTNSYPIADCVAAMFGETGAYVTHVSLSNPTCDHICTALNDLPAGKKCVVVDGVFDGLSLNAFNELLFYTEQWGSDVTLLLSLNGLDINMIPSYVWTKSMYINGDTGFTSLNTKKITSHQINLESSTKYSTEEISAAKKQLKPFAHFISNVSMLNYAKYIVATNQNLKQNDTLLLQIGLHAISHREKDEFAERLSAEGVDLKKISELSRYLRGEIE